MAALLLYLAVGFVVIGVFLVGAFVITLNKMVTDEMRARLDDLPAVLLALALRIAPAHQRDFLQVDWVDNLLVAFDEKNARYPVSRLILSVPFVLPLFVTATGLRKQARVDRRRAEQDEKLERLVERRVVIRPRAVAGELGGRGDLRADISISPAPATITMIPVPVRARVTINPN